MPHGILKSITVEESRKVFVPKTHHTIMPSHAQIERRARGKCLEYAEDQLAADFTEVVNGSLLTLLGGYVMRLCVNEPPKPLEDAPDETHAAVIFRNDIPLEEGHSNWVHQRCFGVFKGKEEARDPDPFDLTLPPNHRTAVYSFFILESEFRFLRWDRSVVIITHKVDYVKDTRVFTELLLGLLLLDDADQGIDTTSTLLGETSELYQFMDRIALRDTDVFKVSVISHQESPIFDVSSLNPAAHKPGAPSDTATDGAQKGATPSPVTPMDRSFVFEYVMESFRHSVQEAHWPRYRLSIGTDTFLVARPTHNRAAGSPFSWGTRVYVAWHEQSSIGLRVGGKTLKMLNDAGVTNVTLASGYQGDVAGQDSESTTVETEPSKERNLKKRKRDDSQSKVKPEQNASHLLHYVHYRLATQEVCLPLEAFRTSTQLVQVVGDSIDAHADAYEKCEFDRCDVSSGNLLVLPALVSVPGEAALRVVWTGILGDLELATAAAGSMGMERRERMGTIRSMPLALHRDPHHVVSIADEMVSFFDVTLYNGLRYLPHNMNHHIMTWNQRYFDDYLTDYGNTRIGGWGKESFFDSGYPELFGHGETLTCGRDDEHPLNLLLEYMRSCFHSRYKIEDYERSLQKYRARIGEDGSPPRQLRCTNSQERKQGMLTFVWIPIEGPTKPASEHYKYAAYLEDYDVVRELFREQLAETWPDDETWEDKLAGYKPEPPMPPFCDFVIR
ncbi:hypothetical protein C8Q74DRAFT_1213991 [Fomes fomentarius]|nr:hypothetical protein C8Q74DRAFT_1213991 [Fomes fomentarius]